MPYPWTQAVVAYTVTCTNAPPAAMKVRMQSIPLLVGEQDAIGGTVINDQTTIAGPDVTRTLTFSLGAQFNAALSPTADPTVFFKDLYTRTLRELLTAPVVAAPPVVT